VIALSLSAGGSGSIDGSGGVVGRSRTDFGIQNDGVDGKVPARATVIE
jgi:hypothetical protein